METEKEGFLSDALESGGALRLDLEVVFDNTNATCRPDSEGRSSGKTGSDVERILAFHAIGRKDPVEYVDDWDTVLERALEIEREYEVVQ